VAIGVGATDSAASTAFDATSDDSVDVAPLPHEAATSANRAARSHVRVVRRKSTSRKVAKLTRSVSPGTQNNLKTMEPPTGLRPRLPLPRGELTA
jgi:hypothetical protein